MEVEHLCRDAEKKMRGGGFLSIFTGGPNYDEAADTFVQAANKCKLQKDWRRASDCYRRASQAAQKGGDTTRQASLLQEAAHALKKVSPDEATRVYTEAADLYTQSGRFGQAAKMLKSIAESLEAEGDERGAMKMYKKAAEYFDMDEYGKSLYTQSILKYAELTARLENNLMEAIKIFEKEGEKALKNTVIQFGAKDKFLQAGILRLALGDSVDMKLALERYEQIDPRFAPSREGKLFRACVLAYEESDEEAFVAAIQEYDSITRLDGWRTHFLFRAREALQLASGKAPTLEVEEDEHGEADLT